LEPRPSAAVDRTPPRGTENTHSRQPRSRRSRTRRAVIALLASTTLGLLVAEIVCRCMFGAPLRERMPLMEVRANKTRGFEMIPNTEHYTYLEHVRVNNIGLRGADCGEKEAGELRIFALGDSLTYGQGMGETETLPHAIETSLTERLRASARSTPTVHVVNGGIRAYNTRQEIALLAETWQRVKPDIAVVFWFANDVDDPDLDAMCARFERTGPVVFDLGEPLTARAELAWHAKQILRQSALIMQARHAYTDSHWPQSTTDALDLAFRKLDGYLDELARLSRLGGFDVAVAVVPLARIARERDAQHPLTARVRELAEKHRIPFLDLVEPVRELVRKNGKLPVLPYDGHYDAEANAALGAHVAAELWKLFPARFGAQ
jgi:lysophospholipase L1-like esterase